MTSRALAIVVPCFNEASVIASSIARLREWFPDAMIVVMDDGSEDNTLARANEMAERDANVRARRLPVNGGKGRAVAAAVPLVSAHDVLIVDADLAFTRDDDADGQGAERCRRRDRQPPA